MCDGPSRHASGLRVPDRAKNAETGFKTNFGQLGRFTRAGLTGNDDNLVAGNGLQNLLDIGGDG